MCDDADGHQLLAVVATVHHEGIGQALDDGALGLAESLCGISTSGMGDVDGGADLDVVGERDICVGRGVSETDLRTSQVTYRESRRLRRTTY